MSMAFRTIGCVALALVAGGLSLSAAESSNRFSSDVERYLKTFKSGGALTDDQLLMELLNKTVRRPSELAAIIPGQPFATLPYIPKPDEPMLSDFWQGWENARQFLRNVSSRLPWFAAQNAGLESR